MDNKELNEEVTEVLKENDTVEEKNEEVTEVVEESNTLQEEIEEVKEAIEEVKEEVEEVIEEAEVKEDSKGVRFLKKVIAGVIDQIISISLSLLLLVVVDLLIKLFGFYIAQREPMFLIIYVIVNIIYGPICTSTKLKDTIGRKTMLK